MSEQLETVLLQSFFQGETFIPTMPSFNRLEGRPRSRNFDQALKAEVRDPLWMLCKQWQMGEFKGDDAGSPVSAKVCMKHSQLTKYQPAEHAPQAYDNNLPLEAKVEQRPVPFSAGDLELALDLRIVLGRHWRKLLRKNGFTKNGSVDELAQAYISEFATHDPDPDNRDDVYYCGDRDRKSVV